MSETDWDNTREIQIRGHGLAGAILAETLHAAGIRIRVFHDGGPSSSRVAAGLYTPLTGSGLNPSWQLDQVLPTVKTFYPSLERTLGVRFFFPMETTRIFRDEKQRDRAETVAPRDFLQICDVQHLPFHAPYGGCTVTGGGWVDLPTMLNTLEERRKALGQWGEAPEPGLTIWAQGAAASEHPLWRECGWRNAHGDVITVEIPELAEDRIYSFGRFLLPLGNQQFRCGSTYAWNQPGPEPREIGREELVSDLRNALKLEFRVSEHRAGIRPVALARVPIVGPHPDAADQWIFNGFGSKGVLNAPWVAKRCMETLRDGRDLPSETVAAKRIIRQRERAKTAAGQKKALEGK